MHAHGAYGTFFTNLDIARKEEMVVAGISASRNFRDRVWERE